MDLKSKVGETAGPFQDVASAERLEQFAAAVGAPVRDEAPPTFLTVCRRGEFELLTRLGIPLERVLHGEQEYEYLAPIRPGDTLSYVTRFANFLEKRGSSTPLQFLIFETDVQVAGRPVAKCRTNIVKK